jgi:hypothetical protein
MPVETRLRRGPIHGKNARHWINRGYSVGRSAFLHSARVRKFMQLSRAVLALTLLAALAAPVATAQSRFGPQGGEAAPNREQQWLVPSPDPDTAAHAVLFRPPGEGPFPLALIAHASTQSAVRRALMPQPEYKVLSAWLVGRGFAVLVPERPGHGTTGGKKER